MSRICASNLIAAASLALAAGACGARTGGDETPVPGPPPPARPARAAGAPAVGHPALIGQMCPSAAAGRPAIRPLFRRAEAWTDRAAEVASPVERHGARQFSVLAWSGRRAGLFAVAGSAALDGRVVAIGGYAGRSPCERSRGIGAPAARDPDCAAALRDCGVAVAMVEPAGGLGARPVEEDPDPVDLAVGGGCVAGGVLLVDVDGDGAPEAYAAGAFAEPGGAPAAEIAAVDGGGRKCAPRFAARSLLAGMDLLAVVDADADGRKEIVVGFQQEGRAMWALYAATATPARLDRVAVAEAWRR